MMRNDDQRSSGEAGIYLISLDVVNMLFSKYKNSQQFFQGEKKIYVELKILYVKPSK